jgi:hypothetical protein
MALDFQRARPLLQSGSLAKLFVEELGWEPCRNQLSLRAGEKDFHLAAIAEKKGFTAWLCAGADGSLPDHTTRLKLDRALTQTSFEHLIVFATHDYAQQSWMWVRREPGKPLSAKTHEFQRSQPGDSLLQKLQILYVSLEEEEAGLSVTEIASRARAAFDIERVTKAFYREFDSHRNAFLKFIDGIGEVADCEWYASVMLNRLMFIYFIQRKGFLDGDHDYLRSRLDRCQKEQGKDKFYTFYRYFLLRLFHEGFGKRRKDRAPDLERLLGNIPYLNGGLFDVHDLEKPERYGKDIQIPDKAFERVFDYFDQYQWHLDERPLRADNEINPDVLGYIFEKYINQKQMGAYYTKEDITEYISKNTVLPFLFDAARAKCRVAFENTTDPTIWDLLRENPDRYIYPAVRHGTGKKFPAEIVSGLDTTEPNLIERRNAWNKPAPAGFALPAEIWREVVARRQRYEEARKKLAAGEVRDVNDFITLNLDLRQFAQDVIQNCEGPDLLMAFWQAITTITVLDPTGGSGAFIFAALNILEPLYEACLDRMETFLVEWGENAKKAHPNYHKKFNEVHARVSAHPNRRYFVLKSIILNNLYAVDIMVEAVEICKLRLFLKLAAQVEPNQNDPNGNLGIEPLPDIDFNIRMGNTLVGYATYDNVKRAVTSTLDFDNAMQKISVKAADLQQAFDKFRELQTEGDGTVPAADKLELQKRLNALEDELSQQLAGEYGVKVSEKAACAKWVRSHQPFHWFIQFYGIMSNGGFGVIIGNPPYVEMSDVAGQYAIKNLALVGTGNLFAVCLERFVGLLHPKGRMGVIVPISSVSTPRMLPLMQLLNGTCSPLYLSHFAVRPGKLFVGVDMNLTIIIGEKAVPKSIPSVFATGYNRWGEHSRSALFQILEYAKSGLVVENSALPKLGRTIERTILDRIAKHPRLTRFRAGFAGADRVYYHSGGRYFRKCIRQQLSNEYKELCIQKGAGEAIICLLSSSLYYWYWIGISDCYHVTKRDIDAAPIPESLLTDAAMKKLSARLLDDLWKHSEKRIRNRADGSKREEVNFYVGESKPILDEIDTVLARHYGFTPEELDFILNYDIKYRLGRDTGEENE